jgi:hypothetical protein
VVIGGGFPAICGVATLTQGTKAAFMDIIVQMTRIAFGRCAHENMIAVAACAGDIHVFSDQFISGKVMIEFGRAPAVNSVAGSTVASIAVLVWVLGVAGIAVLGGGR